jgi:trimeric autotransporter adhesin
VTAAAAVTGLASGAALVAGAPAHAAVHHAPVRQVAAGTISTVAGGVGGPASATQVRLDYLCGVLATSSGLYVSDSTTVRKISPSGWLTTPVGIGLNGSLGDGGPATAAAVSSCGAALDQHGNLVIADNTGGGRIRVVAKMTGTFYGQAMTAGDIYTVAGGGHRSPGKGGPATSAKLSHLHKVAVDSAGNLVFAVNTRVLVVAATNGTFYGQAMTAGDIYSVAGVGKTGYSGDGGPATAAGLDGPEDVTIDQAGNLVIADTFNQRIRLVAEHTGMYYGQAMTTGDIYTVAGNGSRGYSGDGGPAPAAGLERPEAVTVDGAGNLVIADTLDNRVRVVAESTATFYGQAMAAGHIYTVAGSGPGGHFVNGGPAAGSKLGYPDGVAVDSAGNIAIADSYDSRVWVVAAVTGTFYGKAMTAGHIYVVAGHLEPGLAGNGRVATTAQLGVLSGFGPGGVATDSAGNVLITDGAQVLVTAASTGAFYGQAMTAGHIYVVAGTGVQGDTGDGGPATSAEFEVLGSLAVDHAGNILLPDSCQIRVVAAHSGTYYGQVMTAGDVYSVAGSGTCGSSDSGSASAADLSPSSVAVDPSGNLLIGEEIYHQFLVVAEQTGTFYGQAMTAGDVYLVAGDGHYGYSGDGGPATKAEFSFQAYNVAADSAGDLLIPDSANNRIRVVANTTGTHYGLAMTAGYVYTVAGTGTYGFSGDGGPATAAEFDFPTAVAVDGAGNLLITDSENDRVRVVAAATGSYYGVAMTADDVYTVAGDGVFGWSGDGGPATAAELDYPTAVAVDSAGNLVIDDTYSARIREVTG